MQGRLGVRPFRQVRGIRRRVQHADQALVLGLVEGQVGVRQVGVLPAGDLPVDQLVEVRQRGGLVEGH